LQPGVGGQGGDDHRYEGIGQTKILAVVAQPVPDKTGVFLSTAQLYS
jgi:hypothetical protein